MVSIIVEDLEQAEAINRLLHQYGPYIIGRMGIPYPKKQLNLISVAMDAPQDMINALTGSLGSLEAYRPRPLIPGSKSLSPGKEGPKNYRDSFLSSSFPQIKMHSTRTARLKAVTGRTARKLSVMFRGCS